MHALVRLLDNVLEYAREPQRSVWVREVLALLYPLVRRSRMVARLLVRPTDAFTSHTVVPGTSDHAVLEDGQLYAADGQSAQPRVSIMHGMAEKCLAPAACQGSCARKSAGDLPTPKGSSMRAAQ